MRNFPKIWGERGGEDKLKSLLWVLAGRRENSVIHSTMEWKARSVQIRLACEYGDMYDYEFHTLGLNDGCMKINYL
jgi:hypothetical protein